VRRIETPVDFTPNPVNERNRDISTTDKPFGQACASANALIAFPSARYGATVKA
jgi:hypothetical protein